MGGVPSRWSVTVRHPRPPTHSRIFHAKCLNAAGCAAAAQQCLSIDGFRGKILPAKGLWRPSTRGGFLAPKCERGEQRSAAFEDCSAAETSMRQMQEITRTAGQENFVREIGFGISELSGFWNVRVEGRGLDKWKESTGRATAIRVVPPFPQRARKGWGTEGSAVPTHSVAAATEWMGHGRSVLDWRGFPGPKNRDPGHLPVRS